MGGALLGGGGALLEDCTGALLGGGGGRAPLDGTSSLLGGGGGGALNLGLKGEQQVKGTYKNTRGWTHAGGLVLSGGGGGPPLPPLEGVGGRDRLGGGGGGLFLPWGGGPRFGWSSIGLLLGGDGSGRVLIDVSSARGGGGGGPCRESLLAAGGLGRGLLPP